MGAPFFAKRRVGKQKTNPAEKLGSSFCTATIERVVILSEAKDLLFPFWTRTQNNLTQPLPAHTFAARPREAAHEQFSSRSPYPQYPDSQQTGPTPS